jgi:predicted transcriptional regulator
MTKDSSHITGEDPDRGWRFVTNHTQVLLCIAHDPDVRLRDIAETVGITERAAQRILAELVEADFVTRERVGRRNRYVVNRDLEMRHPAQMGHDIGSLIDLLGLPDGEGDGSEASG